MNTPKGAVLWFTGLPGSGKSTISGRVCAQLASTPLETCEKRDPKGMYAKARKGLIQHFTGVDDPYEPPKSPELVLDTSKMSIDETVARVIELIAL